MNELAIRLLKSGLLAKLDSRWALYDVASRTIRSVLVDYARRRSAAKRPTGNGRECSSLDEMVDAFEQSQNIDVLALNDALEQLEVQHERAHSIVTLRFFGGMKFMDIAEHLGVSVSTVEKDWRFARCWLLRILDDDRDDAL